jgi:hypothetical protein
VVLGVSFWIRINLNELLRKSKSSIHHGKIEERSNMSAAGLVTSRGRKRITLAIINLPENRFKAPHNATFTNYERENFLYAWLRGPIKIR